MRQIMVALRRKYEAGLSHERFAVACGGHSKGVAGKNVRLTITGRHQLFPAKTPPSRFAEQDYFQIHQELKTKGAPL